MCELMWKCVLTSVHRQYSSCLVLTALWIDLAALYAVGDVGELCCQSVGAQSGSSGVERVYIVSASQPEHGWLEMRQKPPAKVLPPVVAFIATTLSLPCVCFKAYGNLNKIIICRYGLKYK